MEIVAYPDARLTQKCRPLTDEEIKSGSISEAGSQILLSTLLAEMTSLMRASNGVGLAAPQVGLNVRLFIAELPTATAAPLVFINPELSEMSGEHESIEGCLSLPGVGVKVKRAEKVKVKAKNQNGIEFDLDAEGVLAKVAQHEYDHLEGVLILTRGNVNLNRNNRTVLDRLEEIHERWQKRLNRNK